MSNRYTRRWASGLIVGFAVSLSACESVGDGNGLESVRVVPVDGADGDTVAKTYLCLSNRLQLIGQFDDGQLGNFTDRAEWVSSNPAVVGVSNGEIEIPGAEDVFYVAGTLIPVVEGSATVTANYLGLEASIEVDVGTAENFTITPVDGRVATSTTRAIELSAELDGEATDVTGFATYEIEGQNLDDDEDGVIDEDADQEIALVNATSGVVFGQNVGGPVQVMATFPTCDQMLQAQITVQDPQALILSHQEGFDGEIVVDTSEVLSLFADFGDGPEQDLSQQITFESADTSIVIFSSLTGTRNIMRPIEPGGPVAVSATLSYGDDEETEEEDPSFTLTSNELPITSLEASLDSIAISPLNPSVEALGEVQFSAVGTYDGGSRVQDITRHVSWTSSDSDVVTIGAGISTVAGLAVSRQREDAEVTIEAENDDATITPTVSTTLTIDGEDIEAEDEE